MNKSNCIFATSFVVMCACYTPFVHAAQPTPKIMSKYGEIQSVNNYSSNPVWTPDSSYNQRMPTPIYVTGPDLNTGDCNRIVKNLVTEYCVNRNYCSNLRISDVRPVVMVQLSQLPGHNFATSCGGYIDSIFEEYKKTYGNTSANNIVKPTQQQKTTLQIENPFAQKKSAYEQAVEERTAELEQMQRVTTPTATVNPTDFPKTVADLSFTDRLANTTAGYEPYKNLNAYKTPKFETEDEYYERMKSVLEHNIRYETFGGNATGCPTKYLTNKGLTVSCVPTRAHSKFINWCTNAALTSNCAKTHTIAQSDRDDKTFYAKWECTDGYNLQDNKCIDPNGTNGGGNESGPGYDPAELPTCLAKLTIDQTLMADINSKMSGARKVSTDELKTRQAYTPIAQAVYDYCVGNRQATSQDVLDFNRWIDAHDILPITLKVNNEDQTFEFNTEELFSYFEGRFVPILIKRDATVNGAMPHSTLSKEQLNTDNISSSCATNFYRYGNMAGAFERFISISGLQNAANEAYNYSYAIYFHGDNGTILYRTDNVVVDLLLPVGPVAGKTKIVYDTNYAVARKKLKAFAEKLKATECTNQNLVVFLVIPKDKDFSEVLIKSEPFFI